MCCIAGRCARRFMPLLPCHSTADAAWTNSATMAACAPTNRCVPHCECSHTGLDALGSAAGDWWLAGCRPEMTEWSSFASSATVTAAAEARLSSRLQKSERVECSTGCPEGARRAAGASLRTHAEMPRRNEPGGAAPETAQAAAAPPLPPFWSPARCSDAAAGNPCFNSHLLGRAVSAAARRLLASRSRDQHPAAPRWHVTSGPWNTAAAEGRLRARRQHRAGRCDERSWPSTHGCPGCRPSGSSVGWMGAHLARQLAASYHQPGHHAKILPASPSAEWCTPAEGTSRPPGCRRGGSSKWARQDAKPCAGCRADHARRQSISAVTLLACNCHLLLLGCAWAAARRRRRRRSRRAAAASQGPAARAGSPLLQLRTHPERRSGAHLLPPKTAGGRLHLPCSSWGWLKLSLMWRASCYGGRNTDRRQPQLPAASG